MSLNLFSSEERQHSPSVFQIAQAAGHKRVVDFCYLSNKFFPTPEIIARLGEHLEEIVRNYPSMQVAQCEFAAALTGFPARNILVGNGASELIHLVAARLGERWMMPFPSYMEYENVIRDFKKELRTFQLFEADGFQVDIDRLLGEAVRWRADALVIPNPNSPTGSRIRVDELLQLLRTRSTLKTVVIDESFIEFTSADRADIPTLREHMAEFPQLVIVRSLGKDFGVCGLRLGLVATANLEVLDEIRRFVPIWNIGPLAERFLRLCADHLPEYERARVRCIEETQALARSLAGLPQLRVFPTYSNFILFKLVQGEANSVQLRDYLLEKHGLYVRDCSRKLGLGDRFIRVGTNLPAENRRLVEALREFFATHST